MITNRMRNLHYYIIYVNVTDGNVTRLDVIDQLLLFFIVIILLARCYANKVYKFNSWFMMLKNLVGCQGVTMQMILAMFIDIIIY